MGSKCKISFIEFFFFLLSLTVFGCRNETLDFYRDEMQGHDVWRLPIVKPYQLITSDCFGAKGCMGWSFQSRDFLESFQVDSLNYQGQHILLYSSPNTKNYIVIEVSSRKVYQFANFQEYRNFLESKKIKNQLYNVKTIYDSWKATKELPWKDEIYRDNN